MKHSVEWARLESSKTVSVSSYISDILHGTLEEPLYLFDWSLPLNCSDLAKQLVIPKYFAGKVTSPNPSQKNMNNSNMN
jgi:hypothetical protein